MQSTSATWKTLWASGTAILETRAIIAGTVLTQMSNPVINRALTQGGLSVGNAVSATCQLSIMTDVTIPKAAQVIIEQRLCHLGISGGDPIHEGETPDIPSFTYDDTGINIETASGDVEHIPLLAFADNGLSIESTGGGMLQIPSVVYSDNGIAFVIDRTVTTEWLPAGTFYVSHRTKDVVTGILTLECYDSLLKANAPWEPSDGEWPRQMGSVAAELAGILEIQMDERTTIPTGEIYVIEEPVAGETIHDVLAQIGQACGGNWIITPANKLRLVRIDETPADTVDVVGITQAIGISGSGTITGLRDAWKDENYLIGSEDGIVLDINIHPQLAVEVGEQLIGTNYQTFSLGGAVYDPAAELGDAVHGGANGEIDSVLYSENATLGLAFRGDISAPEAEETSDEYPYIGKADKTLLLAKAYAREVSAETASNLSDELTQEEIFNRLTNNGEEQGLILVNGKLYVNASYINAGELNAELVRIRNLSVEDITSGLIHSSDYRTVSVPMIYPASTLYPASDVFPSNGDVVTSGFAIDFATGQIYGGFYSQYIAELQSTVAALQEAVEELEQAVFPNNG